MHVILSSLETNERESAVVHAQCTTRNADSDRNSSSRWEISVLLVFTSGRLDEIDGGLEHLLLFCSAFGVNDRNEHVDVGRDRWRPN